MIKQCLGLGTVEGSCKASLSSIKLHNLCSGCFVMVAMYLLCTLIW